MTKPQSCWLKPPAPQSPFWLKPFLTPQFGFYAPPGRSPRCNEGNTMYFGQVQIFLFRLPATKDRGANFGMRRFQWHTPCLHNLDFMLRLPRRGGHGPPGGRGIRFETERNKTSFMINLISKTQIALWFKPSAGQDLQRLAAGAILCPAGAVTPFALEKQQTANETPSYVENLCRKYVAKRVERT